MTNPFKLLMIGAMYENGGNTSHRFLDGHPQMYVYPFESQIGTRWVNDSLSSMFPVKYRWPEFSLEASAFEDYKAIIDEEGKIRARTAHVSKFRHLPFEFSDDERCQIYQNYIKKQGRSRAANVEAFFRATFDAWKDYKKTGREEFYVGYSPAITVDAEKILKELPQSHFLHMIRNPWSAYADTKKRPVPLPLRNYMLAWNLNQYSAMIAQKRYPDRMHILRIEDVMTDPSQTLGQLCEKLGLEKAESLRKPSWNGQALEEVYPWGTIRKATPAANLETARELTQPEKDEIRELTWQYLEKFDYKTFV